MLLLCTRDRGWMTVCEATLLAESVDVRWVAGDLGGAYTLDVPASEAERAAAMLADQLAEERLRKPPPNPGDDAPLLLRPSFALALGLASLTIAFFMVTGGSRAGSEWFQRGALVTDLLTEESTSPWWRLVTAATLHVDAGHALGNAGFFVLLGWAAAERFGYGLTMLVWLVTAVAGFAASLLFSGATLTVGASGGLFGLLGAAAVGAAKAAPGYRLGTLSGRERWRAVGAAILLMAFTAFGARANISAHVGGFLSGGFMGALLPRRPAGALWQAGAVIATAAALIGAWVLALTAGEVLDKCS